MNANLKESRSDLLIFNMEYNRTVPLLPILVDSRVENPMSCSCDLSE